MNYLKTSLQSMVGTRQDDDPSSGAAIVERLVERLQESTTFDDRRDALRALKSLSKRYRLDVGAQATHLLMDLLQRDPDSPETTNLIVETLNFIVNGDVDEDHEYSEAESQDLGERFAELLIKRRENVELFLSLIDNVEFVIRLPAVRLFTSLLRYRCKELQELLLNLPGSIPRLTDLLNEQREVVRNEAVLLLFELIRANGNMQKTVAFQNVFERLLDIVYQEGDSIVAEDCLYVILHLLKNNASNQHLFRENSHIQSLVPIWSLLSKNARIEDGEEPGELVWSPQRISNLHLLCQVIRSLVSPANQVNSTVGCQKLANQCGLLRVVYGLVMSGGIPADVLTESINTAAELMRGCSGNQDEFDELRTSADSDQSAIVVLLLSMVSEKQTFSLRCAVLYCVQSFLYKNERGKQSVLDTLLPSTTDTQSVTAGHVLCTGLISSDPLIVWYSCCTLLHCLIDTSSKLKERLLNVQLAAGLGQAPVTLLQQTVSVLLHCQNLLSRLGILMFLAGWLVNCPVAVAKLLQQPNIIPYLTSQAGTSEGDEMENIAQSLCAFLFGLCILSNDNSVEKFNRKALKQIVEKRMGVESLLGKLESLQKSEHYARAAQRPQLRAKAPQEIALDYEFTKLYRLLEPELVRTVKQIGGSDVSSALANGDAVSTAEQHQEIVGQYKDVIKQQDEELNRLRKLLHENQSIKSSHPPVELDSLANDLAEKCRLIEEKDFQLQAMQMSQDETNKLREEVASIHVQLDQKSNEALYYQQQAQEWRNQLSYEFINRDPNGLIAQLEKERQEMDQQLAYGYQVFEQQLAELGALKSERDSLLERDQAWQASAPELDQLRLEVHQLREQNENHTTDRQRLKQLEDENLEKRQLIATLDSIRKEHEDLLLLLADQDVKLKEYKRRLVEVYRDGQVSRDEEDEEDVEAEGADLQQQRHLGVQQQQQFALVATNYAMGHNGY